MSHDGPSPAAPAGATARSVVVVGASAGIGAGVARRLARAGDRVHLVARRAERLAGLVEAIHAEGGSAVAHACDITDGAGTAAAFAAIAADGGIDAVVNAAAVLWVEPFAGQAEESWQAMLATNLGGAIRVTQQAIAHMLPRGRGHVVHITSTAAALAIPHLAVYSATKAGVAQFLAALRGELGTSGLRFTELQIGNTAGTEGGGQAAREVTLEAIEPVLRWTGAPEMMTVDDVAGAVEWALSTPPHLRLDRIVLRERAGIPT